jgi:hypothetical protein
MCLVGIVTLIGHGCDDARPNRQHVPLVQEQVPAGTPIIDLPLVDLSSVVESPPTHKSSHRLDRTIPHGTFAVRFQARTVVGKKPPASMVMKLHRWSRSQLIIDRTCRVVASIDHPTNTVTYQGVFPAPSRTGDYLIEARHHGQSYLAVSVNVQ